MIDKVRSTADKSAVTVIKRIRIMKSGCLFIYFEKGELIMYLIML